MDKLPGIKSEQVNHANGQLSLAAVNAKEAAAMLFGDYSNTQVKAPIILRLPNCIASFVQCFKFSVALILY
jgi:hypothetical protein